MILLDKTSCELLRYLIGLQEAATIMTISRELGQSRRKVYYHLEKSMMLWWTMRKRLLASRGWGFY